MKSTQESFPILFYTYIKIRWGRKGGGGKSESARAQLARIPGEDTCMTSGFIFHRATNALIDKPGLSSIVATLYIGRAKPSTDMTLAPK